MGTVLYLAILLSVLGVVQVYSGDYKSEDIERKTYEISCFKKVELLGESISNTVAVFKRVVQLKENQIEHCSRLIELLDKCGCERDLEDKKCTEEIELLLNFIRKTIEEYFQRVAYPFLTGLDNNALYATWSLGEIRCCCNKIETCIKKYENIDVKLKIEAKECKPSKCNKGAIGMRKLLPDYIEKLVRTLLKLRNLIKAMEEVLELKPEFLKDGKCADEKISQAMALAIHKVEMLTVDLNTQQLVLYGNDRTVVQYAKEMQKDPKECK